MAVKPICSIPDCGKPTLARGWCNRHYLRWRRLGDPLAGGSPSPRDEATRFYREIVLSYDGDECLVWPYGKTKGYGTIHIEEGKRLVHRLVCEATHGAAPTSEHQAAHSCGKGHLGCVTKRHLSWKTPVENCADMVAHGTSMRGTRSPLAKLTEADVLMIRAMRGKVMQKELAKQYGVFQTLISHIQTGKRWAWLD